MVALAVHLPSDQWGSGGVVQWLGSQFGAQPDAIPCLLELVIVLPQVNTIRIRATLNVKEILLVYFHRFRRPNLQVIPKFHSHFFARHFHVGCLAAICIHLLQVNPSLNSYKLLYDGLNFDKFDFILSFSILRLYSLNDNDCSRSYITSDPTKTSVPIFSMSHFKFCIMPILDKYE